MPRTSCTCCGSTWSDGSRRRPRRPSSARSGSGAGVGEARRSRRPPGAAFRDRDHLSLPALEARGSRVGHGRGCLPRDGRGGRGRSEEHTSELQSPFLISYAVFCLKKKNNNTPSTHYSFLSTSKQKQK